MKLFTLDEANEILLDIIPKLEKIRSRHQNIALLTDSVKAAASAAEHGGGGMKSGTNYVKYLYEIGKLTSEISGLGVQIKDYTRGLIDFPAMRDDRVVLLCWQLGEENEIRWWHEIEGGFAGRKPI